MSQSQIDALTQQVTDMNTRAVATDAAIRAWIAANPSAPNLDALQAAVDTLGVTESDMDTIVPPPAA